MGQQQVVAASADQQVAAAGAVDDAVIARVANQSIPAVAAEEAVGAGATTDEVLAAAGADDVVPGPSDDHVPSGCPHDHVVPAGADGVARWPRPNLWPDVLIDFTVGPGSPFEVGRGERGEEPPFAPSTWMSMSRPCSGWSVSSASLNGFTISYAPV